MSMAFTTPTRSPTPPTPRLLNFRILGFHLFDPVFMCSIAFHRSVIAGYLEAWGVIAEPGPPLLSWYALSLHGAEVTPSISGGGGEDGPGVKSTSPTQRLRWCPLNDRVEITANDQGSGEATLMPLCWAPNISSATTQKSQVVMNPHKESPALHQSIDVPILSKVSHWS